MKIGQCAAWLRPANEPASFCLQRQFMLGEKLPICPKCALMLQEAISEALRMAFEIGEMQRAALERRKGAN